MLFVIKYFILRVFRSGAKGLAVPLLAFTLIVLINTLGGIKEWLDFEYNDTMENHVIIAELSDLSGEVTDRLMVDIEMVRLFTEPGSAISLYQHTSNLILRRSIDAEITGTQIEVTLTGISAIAADDNLSEDPGTVISFFDGYDESILTTDKLVCLISEDMLSSVSDGTLSVSYSAKLPDTYEWIIDQISEHNSHLRFSEMANGSILVSYEMESNVWVGAEVPPIQREDVMTFYEENEQGDIISITHFIEVMVGIYTHLRLHVIPVDTEGAILTGEIEFTVIGTVSGIEENIIYSPFWTVNAFLEEFAEKFADEYMAFPLYSERLSMIIADNKELSDFKNIASLSFSRVRPIRSSMPFAMTVYDSTFFETIEPLLQNTILVDIAIPIVYAIAVSVGFLASTLLTRQRKSEFAVMRSVGIHRRDVFTGVFSEQLILSLTGAVFGCALTLIIFKDITIERPLILLGCYLLGTIFAAVKVAGTNVLKVMKDKE